MKRQIRFIIELSKNANSGVRPFLRTYLSPALFERAYDIANVLKIAEDLSGFFAVVVDFHDSRFKQLQIQYNEIGIGFAFKFSDLQSCLARGVLGIWPRIIRRYVESDLLGSEYLYIRSMASLTRFVRREGHLWVGSTEHINEEYYSGLEDYEKLAWEKPLGQVGDARYYVNRAIKDAILSANVVGVEFNHLLWDDEQLVQAEFFELSSRVVMPACLLPVVTEPIYPNPTAV